MRQQEPKSAEVVEGKGLPCNTDVERQLLGNILLDESKYLEAAAELDLECFVLESHRRIFSRMGTLQERGEHIDRLTVYAELMKFNEVESVGGLRYLIALDDGTPQVPHIDSYIREIKAKATLRRIIFAGQHMMNRACHSSDTEGLTPDGWKFLMDITEEEEIAQFVPGSMSVEFVTPIKKYAYHYDGPMVHFKTDAVDMLVTPNHRMWGSTTTQRRGYGYTMRPASEVSKLSLFHFQAKAISASSGNIAREKFVIPKAPRVGGGSDTLPELSVKFDVWLEFLGYYLSEGGLSHKRGHYMLTLSQKKGPTASRIGQCLAEGGFSFGEYPHQNDGMRRWNVYGKALCTWLMRECNGYCSDKRIPRDLLRLPEKQGRILLNAMMAGDGAWKNSSRRSGMYSTTSRQLADDFQELAFGLGYSAGVESHQDKRPNRKRSYTVNICSRLEHVIGTRKASSSVAYSGMVYCFSVPSGILITRRGGKIAIQGNSLAQEDPADILAGAEDTLLKLGSAHVKGGLRTPEKIIEGYEGGISAFLDPSKRKTGVDTGFAKFDEMTGGLHPGDLFILAARPSMGKTALALNIAQHIALKNKQTVAVFSLEMSVESLLTRMLCAAARVDSFRFRCGYLGQEERRRLNTALAEIMEAPLHIDDTAELTLMEMHSKLRRLQQEQGELGLVIVDYLQLMSTRGKSENRNQEVSAYSRGLKLMAKELKVPMLVLSQLSRAVETRAGDKRPQLGDLRESGSIEQDADVVGFVFRQEVYVRDREDLKGLAELIIAKQRNGAIGTVDLVWLANQTKFESRAEDVGELPK